MDIREFEYCSGFGHVICGRCFLKRLNLLLQGHQVVLPLAVLVIEMRGLRLTPRMTPEKRASNLHTVWDSDLIRETVWAWGAYVDRLEAGWLKTNADKDCLANEAMVKTMAATFLGGASPLDPLANPLKADLKGLPPIYIQVGGDEALLDDALRFEQLAKAAGVDIRCDVYPEMQHVFQFMAGRAPEATKPFNAWRPGSNPSSACKRGRPGACRTWGIVAADSR